MPMSTDKTKRDCQALIKANGIDAAFKKFAGVEVILTNDGITRFHSYTEAYAILDGMKKHKPEEPTGQILINPAEMPQAERDAAIVEMMNA